MAAGLRFVDIATGAWIDILDGLEVAPSVDDAFVYGLTEPVCVDPLNPKPTDNVGWTGDSSGGVFGDPTQNTIQNLTIPANTTWSNRIIWANVTMTNATSRLENCIVYGSVFGGSRTGLVIAANGGQLYRCTIYGMPKSVSYYTNGIKHTAGTLDIQRSVVMRVVDGIHTSGSTSARIIDKGNYAARFAVFDNDLDHANDAVRPYATHNDWLQVLTASTVQHETVGTKVESFFDTTGVVWSGGVWGSGTASGGQIGMPSTFLNWGYWSEEGRGTWCNGITFSNQTGHKARIEFCWLDGVNASSGIVQFTTGLTNQPVLKGNRFGLGGKPSGSGKFYLISYPKGTPAVIGTGTDANTFADLPTVPAPLRGQPLTFTDGGASVVP
jgi:hypothetical protein